ncbi:PDZ domain-containing protein [Peribacillus muralis]|uniref:PDZ domain-containing protein n=1 Tax=Peribacillus muralis TaxID=264697 RepID=UPI001F4E3ED9|nr:PDZ domain-containing protein [Peribacillus muralis]MCK1994434.1 PDZ domain-containing protein [Peribacillus muralis]MCK2014781.1 PDZ domain-containing protein [Peribacillus muralis]
MTTDWLIACMIGLGKLFLHPLLYISIAYCLFIGYLRVKRERHDFNTKVYRASMELRSSLLHGLIWGLILSCLTLVSGMTIPLAAMYIMAVVTILAVLTMNKRIVSPVYTVGITFFILFFLYDSEFKLPILQTALNQLDRSIYPTLVILIGLLLIAEGFLIVSNGSKKVSPQLQLSKRGQPIGAYVSQKLWLIPMFVMIPGGQLPAPIDWYPVFSIGDIAISPIVLPFLIGFKQKLHGTLPEQAIRAYGKKVGALGLMITALAIVGYWYPTIAIITAILAILGREFLHHSQRAMDQKLPFYFSKSKLGVQILGVIPHSPADKMGLVKGEVISKINGVIVREEEELYRALQINRAHCKLEVIDNNEQIRFVQRALFDGEHYELGILFVDDQLKESGQAG